MKTSRAWHWLSNRRNQRTVFWIVGLSLALGGAIGKAYLEFFPPTQSAAGIATPGSIAVEGGMTVIASPGGTAVVSTGNVTTGVAVGARIASLF